MPVIVEPRYDIADLEPDLARVYADFPGRDAAACVADIRSALAADGVFYAGVFNGRTVAGVLVSGPADSRRLQLVAVRAATRGRGVALRLVDEVARLEAATGGRRLLVTGGPETGAVLTRLGFAPVPGGYERRLPAASPA